MKLYHYKFPRGIKNFGDDLNPWLWRNLLSDILDEDESTQFIGIGTLLNDRLPKSTQQANHKVVFSTGVGSHKGGGLPKIDNSWKIYCLRGPLSAQALGVSSGLAVTDGAILVRRFFAATSPKIHRFAYMPHVDQALRCGKAWESVCANLGFGYINPCWSTEEVLSHISQTEVLLTEAMHGAIVADALRVAWIPIVTAPSILAFKWQDWCSSIGVDYQPIRLTNLSPHQEKTDIFSPARVVRSWVKIKLAQSQLIRATKTIIPTLSKDARIEQLTTQLEEKLQNFKDDVAAGYFLQKT